MTQPNHILRLLKQMVMDVTTEDYFLFYGNRSIEIQSQFTSALGQSLECEAELLAAECSEIRSIPPQLILSKRLGIMQADNKSGIDVVEESCKLVAGHYRRVI